MEAKFTLPYSEYAVIDELNNRLKKHGYSVYIPTSRQQKGVDLAITKNGTNCMARVQVKSSRSYKVNKQYSYRLWLSNFDGRHKNGGAKKGYADFYIIFGLYPQLSDEKKDIWKQLFLCFNDNEMFEFLDGVRNKNGNVDKFIRFGFNLTKKIDRICAIRYPKDMDVSKYLLEKKVGEIISFLEKKSTILKQRG